MYGFGKDCITYKNDRIDFIVFICTIIFACIGILAYIWHGFIPGVVYPQVGEISFFDGMLAADNIEVMKRSAIALTASVLVAAMGVILVSVALMLRVQGLQQQWLAFFYAGTASLVAGVWVFADIPALRFMIDDSVLPQITAYVSMLFVPVPLLFHLKSKLSYGKNITRALCMLSCIGFAACIFISFFGFAKMRNVLFLYSLFFGSCVFFVTVLYAREFLAQKQRYPQYLDWRIAIVHFRGSRAVFLSFRPG